MTWAAASLWTIPTHKDLAMDTSEGPQLACCTNFLRMQEQNATGYVA